jgi:thiol-disulfide isomerase/thioredoxin
VLPTLVLSAAGAIQAIIGLPVPEWPAKPPDLWVQGGPLTLADLRGKVVLIRFFMESDCPYCRGTAPALNEFHEEFGKDGLVVVGMFTPKPNPRPVNRNDVRAYVTSYGFAFPVAVDADWSTLRALWLDRVPDAEFTSASLLVDRRGILRHVQKGGIYAVDADLGRKRALKDYREMRDAIVTLLAQP